MAPGTRKSTRFNATTDSNSALPAAKRPHRQESCTASAITNVNHLPTPSATQQQQLQSNQTQPVPDSQDTDLDINEITLQNYHQVKKFWPLGRIKEQLDRQKLSNHQLSAAVLAEGKAVLEQLEITLHMIAMVSNINIVTLKRSLGLTGGTAHADNPWHRWLSFAIDANKFPMPTQGDPNALAVLAARNRANKGTYDALSPDQLAVFKSPTFFALGGYPDYSAIAFPEDGSDNDSLVLVPEVPKLSEEDELHYRPIYKKLVNTKKVARDRELLTPASSAAKEEKRSLTSFKKIAQQLERDHQMFGIDYYLIACSSYTGGEGWCREHSSREEIIQWVSDKADLQRVFPIYCQHGSIVEDVQAIAAKKSGTVPEKQASNNQSDIDKKDLGGRLNELVFNLVGERHYKPFPRTPNPIASLKERNLKVERPANSAMSNEDFDKGFTAMNAKARRNWLSDLKNGKFILLKEVEAQASPSGPQMTEHQPQPSETRTTEDQPPTSELQDPQTGSSQIPQVIESSGQTSEQQTSGTGAAQVTGATCDLA
ncbi:uncharacterized protein MELLADRAFT_89796 [Melampsora larici-populina 98AG31]|uniref:Uncharacterized protein n=1 Tax=Melampsora larici-populina (strain 98AG31 / pathotype 3-4-7) TaxID=747676 RepID=F4RUN7_MELLP|nr:uncharacterized protein MELLADRAFT_89796 [Melampsora larici-populina 98AG31]EGG03890.1 hypothetical protein MELLADRAFT_89796 [Melampsora larici-populina 98AG31]